MMLKNPFKFLNVKKRKLQSSDTREKISEVSKKEGTSVDQLDIATEVFEDLYITHKHGIDRNEDDPQTQSSNVRKVTFDLTTQDAKGNEQSGYKPSIPHRYVAYYKISYKGTPILIFTS